MPSPSYQERLRPTRATETDLWALRNMAILLEGRERQRVSSGALAREAMLHPTHCSMYLQRLVHLGYLGCEKVGKRPVGGHWYWMTEAGERALEDQK